MRLSLFLLPVIAAGLAPEAFAAGDDERPNILFIMSDDHGYQALSAYGSVVNETPNLDRIAREGMRFDRCFVTNSICGPSRAVILTGKYSHLNGFERNGRTFNGEQQTVAKLLQEAGYQTAVIGKWHLRSLPTGFEYYHILKGQGPYYNPVMRTPDGDVEHIGYTTDIITDETLEWLREGRDPERPFLLLYQHKAPHRNWQPAPRHLTRYDDVDIPEPPTLFDDYEGRGTAARSQAMTIANHLSPNDLKLVPQRGLTEEQARIWNEAYGPKNEAFREAGLEGEDLVRWQYQRYVKDYLRCVDAVDENVGRVLDYLDESGLAENTIVIYTSDQGWYLGEHGWYDKRWMYEESFRTPLLVRWPGHIEAGSVNDDMVLNLDFPETFLDVAGAAIPEDMQGRSLKPLLEGEEVEDWRDAVYYHYYEYPGAHSVHKHYGVRTDRYKLIYFYELDEWELYDLEEDPHELQSVYGEREYADVQERLKVRLKELQEEFQDDGSVVSFSSMRARRVQPQLVLQLDFAEGGSRGAPEAPGGRASAAGGSGALASFPRSEELDPSFKPFVVGGWLLPRTGEGVVAALGGESLGFSLYLDGGAARLARRSEGQLTVAEGPLLPDDGGWVHLAAVVDTEGKARFYLNGEGVGEPTALGLIAGHPADGLSVGADTGSEVVDYGSRNNFGGRIADVRLYWGPLQADALQEWCRR